MTGAPDPAGFADTVASVSFERRDVETMSRFLVDFGFVPIAAAQDGRRFFRGYGGAACCVEIIPSERDAFVGFALTARTRDDLVAVAALDRRPIEPADTPGGGERVRLVDPDGNRVDFMWGAAPAEPLPLRPAFVDINRPGVAARVNRAVRTEAAPAPVLRIGHVVLSTPSFAEAMNWYRTRFGLLPSDVATVGDDVQVLGFFRFDRGAEPADHHSLALLAGPGPAMLHISTETIDLDAVGQGQQHLRAQGWSHMWGIGRHVLGSQIFDYWIDSAGAEWEHYADGDLMTADHPAGIHPLSRGGLWAWGDDLPETMRPPAPPPPEAPGAAHAMYEAMMAPPRPWLR